MCIQCTQNTCIRTFTYTQTHGIARTYIVHMHTHTPSHTLSHAHTYTYTYLPKHTHTRISTGGPKN